MHFFVFLALFWNNLFIKILTFKKWLTFAFNFDPNQEQSFSTYICSTQIELCLGRKKGKCVNTKRGSRYLGAYIYVYILCTLLPPVVLHCKYIGYFLQFFFAPRMKCSTINAYSICKIKNILPMFKMFWPYSIFFEPDQIFLSMVKNDISPYNFAYLSMVKNIWPHSKILNKIKIFWTHSKKNLN